MESKSQSTGVSSVARKVWNHFTPSRETVYAKFSKDLMKYTLVVGGETRTVLAHGYEENDSRVSFYTVSNPTVGVFGDQFFLKSWDKEEVKGFGANAITDWDVETEETQYVVIKLEYTEHNKYNTRNLHSSEVEVTLEESAELSQRPRGHAKPL